MSEGLSPVVVIAGLVVLLFGLAFFLPSNMLTGNVVLEDVESCGKLGCIELCDDDSGCSAEGAVCCSTEWSTGVCDLERNCGQIKEYSSRLSLETYQDTYREQPAPVEADWQRFFLPIVLIVGVLVYFMFIRTDKRHR